MKIKPLYDRILVTPYSENNQKIIISDAEQSEKMIVLALGKNTSGEIKQGDIVLINRYAGGEFNLDGQKYILIKETDVLGIIGG